MEGTMDEQSLDERRSDLARGIDRGSSPTLSAAQSAKGMLSKTTDMAQQATAMAKGAAADTASNLAYNVKELLDRQVDSGAELVAHFAHSVRSAADDLDNHVPQVAGLVRGISDRIENYSRDLRGQSVDQLMQTAADFTRRQPALVLGLAALAGFFAIRVISATPSASFDFARGWDGNSQRDGGSDGV
jgi:hypothetical protein